MHPNPRGLSLLCRAAMVALLATLSLPNAGQAQSPARKPLVLFSSAEAAQLQIEGSDWPIGLAKRSLGLGPRIIFQRPEVQEAADAPTVRLTSPGALVVRFEPNGAPVDMGTLEVTARKSFFSKSLTAMLKPYINGTTLQVDDLEIPTGKFLIEVAIADARGMQTTSSYRLDVTGK